VIILLCDLNQSENKKDHNFFDIARHYTGRLPQLCGIRLQKKIFLNFHTANCDSLVG